MYNRMEVQNTPTAPLQRGKTPHLMSILDMALSCVGWWGSGRWALVNVEYPFITITPRSTLAWSGSIY